MNLQGRDTPSTTAARNFAQQLLDESSKQHLQVEVRLIDERLSTVTAQAAMKQAGRTQKASRAQIDQAAAVVILEHALAQEKQVGHFVGTPMVASNE